MAISPVTTFMPLIFNVAKNFSTKIFQRVFQKVCNNIFMDIKNFTPFSFETFTFSGS